MKTKKMTTLRTMLLVVTMAVGTAGAWAQGSGSGDPVENTAAVTYIDADGNTQTKEPGTVYILDGTETVLGESGGTSDSYKETWYFCDKDLSYSSLSFSNYCNVNIIVADGKKMSVTNSNGTAIPCFGSLGLYGQSTGSDMGTFTAQSTATGGHGIVASEDCTISHCRVTAIGTGTSSRAIYSSAINITGGTVTAEGGDCGIFSRYDITITDADVKVTATGLNSEVIHTSFGKIDITGSTVTAEGGDYGIFSWYDIIITDADVKVTATGSYSEAIYTADGKIDITGSTVTAEGGDYGISSYGDITITGSQVKATFASTGSGYGIFSRDGNILLDWTNASDFIYASSYYLVGAVKIADGKQFMAYTVDNTDPDNTVETAGIIIPSGPVSDLATINGKMLRPVKDFNPVPAGATEADFVAVTGTDGTWTVDGSKATLFVVTGIDTESGEIELQAVEKVGDEYVIPDGAAVILGGPTTATTPTAENVGNLDNADIILNPASTTSADASTPSEADQGEENLEAAKPYPLFFAGDGTSSLGDLIDAANEKLTADGESAINKNDIIVFMPAVTIGTGSVAHLSFRPVTIGLDAVLAKGAMVLILSKVDMLKMVRNQQGGGTGARRHGIYLNLGGDTTGISEVANSTLPTLHSPLNEWYTIDGRRLDKAPKAKGVYIHRGKVVVVK